MAGTNTIRGRKADEILLDAIEKQSPFTLTHCGPMGWTAFAARPTGMRRDDSLIALTPVESRRAGVSIPWGEDVGVSFRRGHKKCMFAAKLLLSAAGGDAGGAAPREAVPTLTWPDRLDQLQRRAFDRACPPKGLVIPVKLWESTGRDGVSGGAVHYGELEDVSAGGLRVSVPDGDHLLSERTYRCVFAAHEGAQPMLLEAVVRHVEADVSGRHCVGLHFVGLEGNPEGRSTLNRLSRLVAQFQRANGQFERRDREGGATAAPSRRIVARVNAD